MEQGKLLTVAQAAAQLGVSRQVAYRMARRGQLPGLVTLAGRHQRVKGAVLERWLREG